MQLQRLFEIIYILLYKKRTTAKELAQRFEVSTRTIYRDIETLSNAGIPIYTNKGKEGGIFLMDHFILNRSLLSENEQKEILSSLQGLQALDQTKGREDTLKRMQTFFQHKEDPWIEIDLSDWSNERQKSFQDMKKAIWYHQKLQFQYSSTYGLHSERTVRPLQLWFKDHAWYLRAYCDDKKAIRTFKTTRMNHVTRRAETFDPIQLPPITNDKIELPVEVVTLHIQKEMGYRVYDEFDEELIELQEDGSFIIRVNYYIDQWVYGNLMSYGPALQVLEPAYIKEELMKQLQHTLRIYEQKKEG